MLKVGKPHSWIFGEILKLNVFINLGKHSWSTVWFLVPLLPEHLVESNNGEGDDIDEDRISEKIPVGKYHRFRWKKS